MQHTLATALVWGQQEWGMGGWWVGKGKGEHVINYECSQHKSYKAKEKKPSFPQTTLTHSLNFIL